jgi:hypothetical protein
MELEGKIPDARLYEVSLKSSPAKGARKMMATIQRRMIVLLLFCESAPSDLNDFSNTKPPLYFHIARLTTA